MPTDFQILLPETILNDLIFISSIQTYLTFLNVGFTLSAKLKDYLLLKM